MNLNSRQKKIVSLVKELQPVNSEYLANRCGVTKGALRADLSVLTMCGILEGIPKVGYVYTNKPYGRDFKDYVMAKKVKDFMSTAVSIDENTLICDAIVDLFTYDVGSLIVENNKYLRGIVSRKDLLKSSMAGINAQNLPVGIIMTRIPNIVTASPEDNLYQVIKQLVDHEIDSIPVVKHDICNDKEQLRVLGRVSKSNIIKEFIKISEEV